jgi:lipopolysaccharide export system protein LptA
MALLPPVTQMAGGASAKPQSSASEKQPAAKPPQPKPAEAPAGADGAPAPSDDESRDKGALEVTSDGDLEWLQQDHAYIARGNVVAKRGTVTLMADTLIAYYRPVATAAPPPPPPAGKAKGGQPDNGLNTGNTEIWRVVADGHVHIVSGERDAFGDHADYDKDKAVVVLTGHELKASSLTEIVTARDTLEYWDDPVDTAVARGNALLVKYNGESLAADVIGGHFIKNAQGQTQLKTIEGRGGVVVTTRTDVVHGDEGTYDLDTQRTVLFGNVKATRAASEVEGNSAEVDMQTGISQVFPGPGTRVRALFVRSQTPEATNAAANPPASPKP